MDFELVKKLALQFIVSAVLGLAWAIVGEKFGIGYWQGFALLMAGFVAWAYHASKTEQKELQAKLEDVVEAEVERRCKERETG